MGSDASLFSLLDHLLEIVIISVAEHFGKIAARLNFIASLIDPLDLFEG